MSCEKCMNIEFRPLDELDPAVAQNLTLPESRSNGDHEKQRITAIYVHHGSVPELERSSAVCHVCHKLFSAFELARERQSPETQQDRPLRQSFQSPIYLLISDLPFPPTKLDLYNVSLLSAHCGPLRIYTMIFQASINFKWLDHPGAILATSAVKISGKDTTTTSAANVALGKCWYDNCIRTHELCSQQPRRSILPFLVLDISTPKRPALVEGNGRHANYVTLSYKWGDAPRLLTTSENFVSMAQGISVDEMPKTFSDAVQVAHGLGLSFLWIDALCIRHDIPLEVHQQIAAMDSIYAFSSLTVFAVWGDSAQDGLTVSRDPWLVKPSELEIGVAFGGKHLRRTIHFNEWSHGEDWEYIAPLYKRGWVLQEQVLASRGLLFGKNQIAWQCSTLRDQASERTPIATAAHFTGSRVWSFVPTDYGKWLLDPKLKFRPRVVAGWYKLVENFSSRQLTYSSDVLPALAGIASAICQHYDLHYLAGLWWQDMAFGLLWGQELSDYFVYFDRHMGWLDHPSIQRIKVPNTNTSRSEDNATTPRQVITDKLTQPPQPVSWLWIHQFGRGEIRFLTHRGDFGISPEPFPVFQVLDAVVTHQPADTKPFGGSVKFGMLKIRSRAVEARVEIYNVLNAESNRQELRYALLGTLPSGDGRPSSPISGPMGELYLDSYYSASLDDGDTVLCIYCVQYAPSYFDDNSGIEHCCVVVVPAEKHGQYRRIGVAKIWERPRYNSSSTDEGTQSCETRVLELI